MNKIKIQCNNGFIIYLVTNHDKKKKRIICSFSWQIGKTKNISREMAPFFYLINLNFLNNKKYIKNKKKSKNIFSKKYIFKKIYFQKNNFQKKQFWQ